MPCEEIWRDVFVEQVIDDGLYDYLDRDDAPSRPVHGEVRDLKVHMPSHVRQIRAVKVMGVTIARQMHVGSDTPEFLPEYYALRIKEIATNGGVISNNQFADNALCVLSALPHDLQAKESVESSIKIHKTLYNPQDQTFIRRHSFRCNMPFHTYDPQGLACVSFTPMNLPSLTVELVDREGKVAEVSRVHLWLRVLTTQD